MNKHQRAKHQKVQMYRKMAYCFIGRRPSYKEGKRAVRHYDRIMAKVAELPKKFAKERRRRDYERRQNKCGYHADILIIDESTPVADTPMWPKVNPYDPRFSGVQILRSDGFIKVVTPND